jgi:F0F1-type ATP synthase delta subunit
VTDGDPADSKIRHRRNREVVGSKSLSLKLFIRHLVELALNHYVNMTLNQMATLSKISFVTNIVNLHSKLYEITHSSFLATIVSTYSLLHL